MWKKIMWCAGALAGGGLAAALVQFAEAWIIVLAALVGGHAGLLVGIALDARRLTRPAVLGSLGFVLGAVLGGVVIWQLAASRDTFSGGGLAGLFLGTPLGALLGSSLGIWAGGRASASQ